MTGDFGAAPTKAVAGESESRLRRFFLIAVAALFTLAYLGYNGLPGNDPQQPLGWWGWWDQGQYFKSAKAIARWALSPDTYWYPLGYPAMGALLVRAAPNHPFFGVDLALVLISARMLWSISRRYMSAMEFIVLATVFIASHAWLLTSSQVVPWNTLPVQAAIYAAIAILLSWPAPRATFAITLLVALVQWTRPIDTLALAPLLAAAWWKSGPWAYRLRLAAYCTAIVAVSWLAEASVKMSVFHALVTPYDRVAMEEGFFSWPIAAKIYWLFVDGREFFAEERIGLLFAYPWLFLAPASMAFVAVRGGMRGAAIAAAISVTFLTYIAFNDWLPWNVFLYLLIHYVAWTFPVLFVSAYAMLRNGGLRWWGVALASAAVLLLLSLVVRFNVESWTSVAAQPDGVPVGASRPMLVVWKGVAVPTPQLKVSTERRDMHWIADYLVDARTGSTQVLLSPRVEGRVLKLKSGDVQPDRLEVGTLAWSAGFDATRLGNLFPKSRLFGVSRIARSTMDISGPSGTPDGEADAVATVDGRESLLSRIVRWEIQIPGGGGAWTTDTSQRGLWIIVPKKSEEGRRELYFKDNAHVLNAKSVTVAGFGADGVEVARHTYRR